MARARLGMVFQDLRGTVGEEVLVRTRAGLAVRRKAQYKFHSSPVFAAASDRLRVANAVWTTLDASQAEAWKGYADTQRRVDEVTGVAYSPTGKNAFVGLAVKFLQATPDGAVPVSPPMSDFDGETWGLGALASSSSVVFTAPAPNTPGVTTEVLLQRLLNVRRTPTRNYKSAAFHVFEAGSLEFVLPLKPGVYAFAFRFVRLATGQATPLKKLGVLVVGA